ncbi:MAG TPA: LysM peptidoglycan-binding domain-containing protein, partial [Anaerolineales bacterium]|nr:LysM peptidoglycan-binding domain-containing protein [Anaerolineales bacterium]
MKATPMLNRIRIPLIAHLIAALLMAACNRVLGTPPTTVEVAQVEAPTSALSAPTRPATATLPPIVLPADGRRATVSEIVNTVEARAFSDAQFISVEDGAVIGVGGQVRTGAASRARIDLSQGTVVRLAADSVFTVEALTDSADGPFALVKLELGKLWVSLTGGSVQVITPVGVASVRGSFAIFEYDPGSPDTPDDDVLVLDCLEGTCNLQSGGISQEVGNLQRLQLSDGGQNVVRVELTGADVDDFIANNPEVGQSLQATLTAAASQTAQQPSDSTATPTNTPEGAATPGGTPVPVLGRHTVRSGESMFCIGRAYGVLPSAIAQANNIDLTTGIFPGDTLVIPSVRWVNIPAGPVCQRQFESPFPAGPAAPIRIPVTVVIESSPLSLTETLTATATLSSITPTPVCNPPEFFDPLMNRCRIDATPLPQQAQDTSPPSVANVAGSTTIGCVATFTADVSDSGGSGVGSVSITLSGTGPGLPMTVGMSLISGTAYQAVVSSFLSGGGNVTLGVVTATDGAGNSGSASKTGSMTGGGSCFGTLIVIGKDNNPISGLGLDNLWFWVLFGAIT